VMFAPLGGLFVGMLADQIGDQLALGVFGLTPTLALSAILALGYSDLREL
jgi:hypothetical protein